MNKTNGMVIKDFINIKGVSRKHISILLGLTTRALYNIMEDLTPLGLSEERRDKFNEIFKQYNFKGTVK